MPYNNTKPVYDIHAVKRMIQRRLPVDAIEQIAKFGVTVQEDNTHCVKRGELNGQPIHVIMIKPDKVKTVYVADEWESTITVHRRKTQCSAM